ncbi:zinc finger protein Xfin [Ictalurus furcatus]|uniref:zinc finger protein Xfin n=1 Tax=Ictalurus furcatus TaxID=66913 RepID=UPI00235004C3|nr:zinc finger protein Xfin [Ictalurus furcatus]XP_053478348.1 zinc finger protein Xfin [Ictalurus furcatus]
MSSELTIDIQLTELGFSSWDFQVLKQKETHQTSDQEYASSSSSSSTTTTTTTTTASSLCPIPVENLMDEDTKVGHNTAVVCPNSCPGDKDYGVNASLVHADSTETSTGESSKTVCEKENGHVGEKRKKCGPWYDENADQEHGEDKKKKLHKDQRENDELRETGAQRKLMSDVSGDEEENEEEEEEEEEEEDDDYDDDLTADEECDDVMPLDTNGSEEYRCQLCKLTFSTTFLLHEHLHMHNGVRLYQCAECAQQFCHLVSYRKHLRSHAKAPPIQCIICTAQFTTQEDLQQHLDTNHFEDKFYQCDLCKRIFTSMAECKKHVQTHKRRTKRYPCPKCERSFRHRSSMLYHLKRHNKGVFLCTDCGLAFSTKAVLLRHSFHHLGLLPYTCIRCKRHFRLSSQYMKHECKPEQLQCEACLVVFQSQEDFLKHKKDTGCWGHQTALSTKTNDIRCMECGQVFDSTEELKKHAGTHQRVMRCSECGMGFRSSIMLMSHMVGHAAKRPCLCKECGLGFCHQQAYDSHLKTCGLANPAEIVPKKQKPNSLKKEAVTIPKSKEIQTIKQLVHMHPTAVVSDQTKPAEVQSTFTLNKEPVSPIPLVMILPVPSTSASKSIQNPQKLNSDVSKKCLSAPQVIHIPLPPNKCSVRKESGKTVLLKDMASPVPGSNILIPLTSGPCTSGSVTKIYVVKKEKEQVAITHIPQLNAKNEQKKTILSSMEILQILNVMKKNVCVDKKAETPSSLTSAASDNAEVKADDEKQGGLRLENSNPSLEKSSDGTTNTERDSLSLSAVNMQPPCPDVDSSAVMLDSSPVKTQPKQDQIPQSSIHSSSKFSLNPDELSSKNSVQKTDQPPQEEDFCLYSAQSEYGDESEIVQCEICGKIILEKDLDQHTEVHSVSSVLATS